METIGSVFNYIITHKADLIIDALAISGAFAQVAQVTPWLWDDQASGVITKVLALISGNLGTVKGK